MGATAAVDSQPGACMRRPRSWLPLLSLCLLALQAQAQEVVRQDEFLHADRPEACAMNRVAAASLLTAFGETPRLQPWHWTLARKTCATMAAIGW